MATVRRKRKLVNPSKRRRMSLKQKLHFGTARVRAAAKKALSRVRKHTSRTRVSRKRRNTGKAASAIARARSHGARARAKGLVRKGVVSNIGEIFTLGLNPGGYKTMARRRRKVKASSHRRRTRRVSRRRNPQRMYAAPTRRRNRRRVSRRRNRARVTRRRNPGMIRSTVTNVLGVVGGAAATKLISDRLPFNLNTGIPGYISTAVVSMLLGWAVGKFGKQPKLGEMMTLGGFTYLGLKVMGDFFPSLASLSPFGLRGMGVIGPSSFYTPQVNRAGSMGSFLVPSAVTGAIPAPAANGAMKGIGLARRTGRLM